MINCIIIDDEQPARDSLALLINRYFKDTLSVFEKCASLKEGVEAIKLHHPDLVFLDVEMPEESGLKLFSYFKEINFSVIFTTAYREYAINAVKLSAIDYLLKPVSPKDIQSAILLYEKKLLKTFSQHTISEIINKMKSPSNKHEKIAFPTTNGYQMENVDSVVYCEANQSYTKVHLLNGDELIVSKPLAKIEELLEPYPFFRIHKSFLINLKYVKNFTRRNGAQVLMETGVCLSVAFRRVDAFIDVLTRTNNK